MANSGTLSATLSATVTRFEAVVRAKLIENKLAGTKPDSIRGLAAAMANGDPSRSKTFKRSLHRWMAAGDPRPTPASRALVARALGVEPTELDEDDEEADPVSLDELLKQRVQAEIDVAMRRLRAEPQT